MHTVRCAMRPSSWSLGMASMTWIPRIRTSPEFIRRRSISTMGRTLTERTDVDVRIGVTQAPRELTIELPDDLDREALKTKVEAALAGAVDVLWLTDKRNRDVGVSSAKIAYIEIGSPDSDRKIGFSG